MNIRLPTTSAKRIIFRKGLNDRFSDEEGNKNDSAWLDAIANFQRMILCGTEVEVATKAVANCLFYDPKMPEDQNEDLENDLALALQDIADLTIPEARALVIDELTQVAASRGGSMSWFDGKTKFDSIVKLIDMTSGKETRKELDGLIFKVMQQDV